MEPFDVQRSLINSKFEGYKLDLPHGEVVARYDLPYRPTQATVSSNARPLSFQEVQSRITHNHLTLSNETNHALYVDSANRVVLITLANPPTFQVIYELPKTVQGTTSFRRPEYPSAIFFRSDVILAADGHGLLYVLKLRDDDVSQVLGVFTTSSDSLESPFRIHSSHRESQDVAIVLLTGRYYEPNFASSQRSAKSEKVEFDVCAIRIDLPILNPNVLSPLRVIWQRGGREIPIYTGFVSAVNAFLLIGGSVYRELNFPQRPDEPSTYEPSPDEYAPIPRTNENLDGDKQDSPKPHLYSWTQSSDSVSVAFPLPSSTPKTKIKVFFSPKALTLHVDSEDSDSLVGPSVPIPNYSAKLLWDSISPSTSFWTWDREADRSVGLLTLYLDKANEGTRWMQVFAAAATSTSADSQQEDAEVPETLDPSELWHIRETLEKYTEALRTGQDTSGLGLGTGVPSLGQGEMDEEVDQSIGREACQTWIGLDGCAPSWWKNARPLPFNLLSTPLPGALASDPTLIIKSHIDGALFSPIGFADPPRWEHTSSFSALAFVLASKRDTRFTYHTDQAVFAFEGGTKDRGGNVYIYRVAPVSSKWAKQTVLKIDDGRGGSLLGVGAWSAPDGLELVCLTEGELVLVKSS